MDERSRSDGPKVLFVAATGRSGSTLLDTMLGQLDAFFSGGELLHLWDDGLVKRRLCGCNLPVPDCPVWQRVIDRLEARTGKPLDPGRVAARQSELLRSRNLLRLARASNASPSFSEARDQHVSLFEDLYLSISEVTGARVIIDSSKRPQQAASLRASDRIRPYLLHLVRDPRGVARSMQRHVLMQPQSEGDPMAMKKSSIGRSAYLWQKWNLAIEGIARTYPPFRRMRLRYEDLVANPSRVAAAVALFLAEPFKGLQEAEPGTLIMAQNHTAWGNPSRYHAGELRVNEDRAWRKELTPREKRLSTLLNWPLMLRYGYPILDGGEKTQLPPRLADRATD